jgi:hypothetical protein
MLRVFGSICLLVGLASNSAGADEPRGDQVPAAVAKILGGRCLNCHNDKDRKGEFSLEHRTAAFADDAISPGQPEASGLIAAVTSTNGDRPAMPKEGKPLSDDEVKTLREWIAAGAAWPEDYILAEPENDDFDWWSFRPIGTHRPPRFAADTSEAAWIRTPIDAFIAKTLNEQGLSHASEASRAVLIRRLSFDLLGLPPSPEEIEAFVNDPNPLAYERLVDRLLESPHYGERWARHWLDVVKYADTCGYDKDKLRPNAWPYRDYVIRSFNDDKPYARFVQEQLAGDVLFPGQPDGILGLGFIAAGPWDFIGHVEVSESKLDGKVARHTDRDEMVSNTMNTFCSLTVQCCQCHNHKFDPFTQKHYYDLQAVFAAVDRAERPYDLDPGVESQKERLRLALASAEQRLRDLKEAIRRAGGDELVDLERAIAELRPRAEPVAKSPEYGYHSGIETRPDVEKWAQIDLGRPYEVQRVVLHPCHDEFAEIGSGFGFPNEFRIEVALDDQDFGTPASRVDVSDPVAIRRRPGIAPVTVQFQPRMARYIRITATRLAERQQDFIFALAELEAIDTKGANVASHAVVTALDSIEAPVRWRLTNLTDDLWPRAADEQAAMALAQAYEERERILQRVETPERVAEKRLLETEIASIQKTLASLPAGRMVYAAASRFEPQGEFHPTRGVPRPVRVLHRGNVSQALDEALPGTVPLAPGAPTRFELPPGSDEGARRAALANWISDADNPLTWRSIVNRVWQHHFGRGLVDSPNDFGRMGKLPSHPELLDWLAADFRDHGQSMKRLHRLIVTSGVYQQTSDHNEANAAIDGENRFLWRMNRRRLEAEEIRDAMLAVSGRLNPAMGGPGYYLFVLERPEHSPHYEYEKFDASDPGTHRRSVYRFVVRSQPDPYMTTLDCADSSQSTPQRNETLTAPQALSLLNNDFSLVMSKAFAGSLESSAGTRSDQLNWAYRAATGHAPSQTELNDLVQFSERHGLVNTCRVLLNLNEFVFVD